MEPPALARPRGRVRVVDGRIVTDLGTPLRGVTVPLDVGWSLEDFEFIEEFAETTGLNAIHLYAENWTQEPGTNQTLVDLVVSQAESAGLYVVLGRGGGPDGVDHPGNGWFDRAQVLAFWEHYAGRYRDATHVLYEIQNNPEIGCSAPSEGTSELQRTVYARIRELAPETHIGLYSVSAIPTIETFDARIAAVDGLVDWSNASIFVHGSSECLPLGELAALVEHARGGGVPLLVSQLPIESWAPVVEALEELDAGWLQHLWLSNERDPATWIETSRELGLRWCPDQGVYPEDSSQCHFE